MIGEIKMNSYNDCFKDIWYWIGREEGNGDDRQLLEQEERFSDEGGK
jgi:hypothetical protein